jgi:hypothetical protein
MSSSTRATDCTATTSTLRTERARPARRVGYVLDSIVVHHHRAVTDRCFPNRRTLRHWRSIARFVRKRRESLQTL